MKLQQFLKSNAIAIVALLTIGTTMSFKLYEKKADTTGTLYFYISPSKAAGAFHDISNWNTQNNDDINCSSLGERPCKITVPQGQNLFDVLGSKENDEVLLIAEGRKP